MRIGVVDIGSNSTRLLAADVEPGGVTVLDRDVEIVVRAKPRHRSARMTLALG